MTQEEKTLLLNDLCARLPYGLMCLCENNCEHFVGTMLKMDITKFAQLIYIKDNDGNSSGWKNYWNIKPYLRPWSSMTEEEKKEERELWDIVTKTRNDLHYLYTDFLLTHHLDYRGLIEKGLALEAPKGMYKFD